MLLPLLGEAQLPEKAAPYWVYLTDKGDLGRYAPQDVLSPRALARRAEQGIALTASDYPVDRGYLSELGRHGQTLRPSKWLNAVAMRLKPSQVAALLSLPFVSRIEAIQPVKVDYAPLYGADTKTVDYRPGLTYQQLHQIGLDSLHRAGYMGYGVVIAVLDNGFSGVNERAELAHLFQDGRVLATYDFVHNEEDVFNGGSHGAAVLSILAAHNDEELSDEFNFYGSAPAATYILCHTENDAAEVHQEEYNWVAGMEFADSLGADIFSTSLGYRYFDPGEGDYTYAGMDGNTTVITRASDLAASKGILVINSAGNSGTDKITAPADGDSVLAVAAVDSLGMLAFFSAQGPAADGDLKPNIAAMGLHDAFINSNGQYSFGAGTSFSCPIISGFAACLMQSKPSVGNMELFRTIELSGDRVMMPDTLYGYGIPSAGRAWNILHGVGLPPFASESAFGGEGCVLVHPNPAGEQFSVVIDNEEGLSYIAEVRLIDMAGRLVFTHEFRVAPFYFVIHINRDAHYPGLPTGQYVLQVWNKASGELLQAEKIRILR